MNCSETSETPKKVLSWTERATEPFFNLISPEQYHNNQIDNSRVYCAESSIVDGQYGVFAKVPIPRGEIVEWGIVTRLPNVDVRKTDHLFTWSSTDMKKAAVVSGCGLFYNTLGYKSNCRYVPYHSQNRFEIYALHDIAADEELTFRYDSMNHREEMQHLIDIVGLLQN